MPPPSLPAPIVPPCLSPDSANAWERLRNYARHAERRLLLVIRHNSPRLPRELPALLAAEFQRPLITANVSDAEPDPMLAALHAAPGGDFPSGCLLSISGAEDLAVTATDNSRAALYEFARRLDFRRDQFIPHGGIVLVWATARVFDVLAEHALNFISRAATILTLTAADTFEPRSVNQPSTSGVWAAAYRLPSLPSNAPEDLLAALVAFEDLAVANEHYHQGGTAIAHALAEFDAAWDRIETGRQAALLHANLGSPTSTANDPFRDFARALVLAYPDAGGALLSLRLHPQRLMLWLEDQLQAARLVSDRQAEGHALNNLGIVHNSLGDARKAMELYEQDLVITRELGDRHGESVVLGNLGNAYSTVGDVHKSIEFYERSLIMVREVADRRGEGAVLGNLGNAYTKLGDLPAAIDFQEQALVVSRETGDRRAEGQDLGNLGTVYSDLGDVRKAIELYEHQLVIAREISDRRAEGNALGNLGNAHAILGDTLNAIEFYKQQLAVTRETGDRQGEGHALWNDALVQGSLGNRAKAIAKAKEALAIFEAIETPKATKVLAKLAKWEEGKLNDESK